MRRRKESIRGNGETAPEIFDDRLTIDGVADGAPHAEVLENRIAKVERQILIVQPGSGRQSQTFALQLIGDVGHEIVHDEIRRALAQLEPAHDVVGHDFQRHARVPGRAAEVIGEPLHLDRVINLVAREFIGAGADRMIAQLPARAGGDDLHVQVDQEGAGRLFQHKPHRVGVERRDRIEIAVAAPVRRRHLWIENARERVHDIVRRELVSVMKMHALSEVHQIGLIVRRLP